MGLKNATELLSTRRKLQILENRLAAARKEATENPRAHELSMRSLKRVINQLQEEIARYEAHSVAQ